MSGMNALPVGLGLVPLVAGVPPQAAATKTIATRPPSQRNDLPLMIPPSDVVLPSTRAGCATAPPPRHDPGDAVPVTGFRQAERISVMDPVISSAPWERNGRSLAPREGHSTFSCSLSSRPERPDGARARPEARRAAHQRGGSAQGARGPRVR